MSASVQSKRKGQHEIPDPVVVFRYRNSPPRQQDTTIDHQMRLSLDWSRLKREAVTVEIGPIDLSPENDFSPEANIATTTTTAIISTDSEDSSADGSRLQIAWDSEHSETQSQQSECSESSESMVSSSVARRASVGSSAKKFKSFRSNSRQFATRRWADKVDLHNVEIPIVYHRNMARKFPTHERTPAQLEQRRRNTVAARLSRAKMKMAERLMEQEQELESGKNISIKRTVAAKLVYVNALRKLQELPSIQLTDFDHNSPIVDTS